MLRDIRELTDDEEAYAAELNRRWGGLLSYRYIGRKHASMNTGPVDETVTLRHDMRDATGSLLHVGADDRLTRGRRGLRPRRRAQPGHPLHPDPRPRSRRAPHRGPLGAAAPGPADGLQPLVDRRRRQPRAGAGGDRGAGRHHRDAARGPREDGRRADRGRRLPRPAAAVEGVRGVAPRRRPLGPRRAGHRAGVARRCPAHRAAGGGPRDRRHRPGRRGGRHRAAAGRGRAT